MMRGTPGMRLTLAILSPIFLLLCVVAIHSEETQAVDAVPERTSTSSTSRAPPPSCRRPQSRNDAAETSPLAARDRRSRRTPTGDRTDLSGRHQGRRPLHHLPPRHRQPAVPDAPQPFRTHPGEVLKHHDISTLRVHAVSRRTRHGDHGRRGARPRGELADAAAAARPMSQTAARAATRSRTA